MTDHLRCPYCNHYSYLHEIKDASLAVHCSDCLGGICPHSCD